MLLKRHYEGSVKKRFYSTRILAKKEGGPSKELVTEKKKLPLLGLPILP